MKEAPALCAGAFFVGVKSVIPRSLQACHPARAQRVSGPACNS